MIFLSKGGAYLSRAPLLDSTFKGKLKALPSNTRIGKKQLAAKNTLAYGSTEVSKAVKSFIAHVLAMNTKLNLSKKIFLMQRFRRLQNQEKSAKTFLGRGLN
jgi:hypothetical protein